MGDVMTSALIGYVDRVDNGVVFGWAARRGHTQPVEVELVIDGLPVSSRMADDCRQDLIEDPGVREVNHGFAIEIPKLFFDGKLHDVQVRAADTHELLYSNLEGDIKLPVRSADPPSLPRPALRQDITMSIIMPTFNRSDMLERSAASYLEKASAANAELIVVDDGSTDDTPERLERLKESNPHLIIERVQNGGPARARNIAASMARAPLLVFVGDDVMPTDSNFLSVHAAAHRRFPRRGQSILGKISWPDRVDLPVNHVMSHIQGVGEQQFGFRSMKAYSWYDWPMFYSSNVSVKKDLVEDWVRSGFDASFYLAAFEDAEFALRTSQRVRGEGEEFGIFYAPSAHLVHYHSYTAESFVRRQVSCGMMAHRFLELHPNYSKELGLADLLARLSTESAGTDHAIVDHYLSVFEGLKSWAIIIESHYGLGTQNWHDDLLRAVFQLAYYEGYIRACRSPNVNLASGCRFALEQVRALMGRAIATEALGDLPGFGLV